MVVIPRRYGFAAPRLRVNLLFQKQVVINNAGTAYASIRFSPTSAYDVDPLFASTAMPGFAEYALLYRFYRVHSSHILVDFVNQEAFGLMAYVVPTNSDFGANFSLSTSFFGNPRCKQITIGPATGNPLGVIQSTFTTASLGGVSSLNILDSYSSLVSTVPSNNWWWHIGTYSPSALVSGIFASIRIEIEVEFFENAEATS